MQISKTLKILRTVANMVIWFTLPTMALYFYLFYNGINIATVIFICVFVIKAQEVYERREK